MDDRAPPRAFPGAPGGPARVCLPAAPSAFVPACRSRNVLFSFTWYLLLMPPFAFFYSSLFESPFCFFSKMIKFEGLKKLLLIFQVSQ